MNISSHFPIFPLFFWSLGLKRLIFCCCFFLILKYLAKILDGYTISQNTPNKAMVVMDIQEVVHYTVKEVKMEEMELVLMVITPEVMEQGRI